MSKLTLRCWDKGHITEVEMIKSKVEHFLRKCDKLKNVCPSCKPDNKHIYLVARDDDTFFQAKTYQCKHGHLTVIRTFGESARSVSVKWGPGYTQEINFSSTIQELPGYIDSGAISCHHTTSDGGACCEKLTACDDVVLSYPAFSSFKTKTRVEDVWKKYKVAEPKLGEYSENLNPSNPLKQQYVASEFEKRNKERLKKMQRSRNISKDRLPGQPLE